LEIINNILYFIEHIYQSNNNNAKNNILSYNKDTNVIYIEFYNNIKTDQIKKINEFLKKYRDNKKKK